MRIIDNIRETLTKSIEDSLSADNLPEKAQETTVGTTIGRKAIIEDPFYSGYNQQGIFKTKNTRLSNKMLQELSLRDWLVSSIIMARISTLLTFSRPVKDKFGTGYRFIKREGHDKEYTKDEILKVQQLEDFVYNCGRTDRLSPEDKMLFGEFLAKTARDILTIGPISLEKIFTKGGALHNFRPVPSSNVFKIDDRQSKNSIEQYFDSFKNLVAPKEGTNDPRLEQKINEVDVSWVRYVQVDNQMRPLAAFGHEDMIYSHFCPQNFMDNNGYSYSVLELALANILKHIKVTNYNSNYFTHGYAARGLLHLKGTVTQSQLKTFKQNFYNEINGSELAWHTPIIAGLDDVQWIPMTGSAKDMEYIQYSNTIMRSICTQFQIDPVEVGLDYLVSATGKSPGQQANTQFKIEYSRERGLQPLIMFYEDIINEHIIPALDPDLAAKYKFEFVGYTDETPQTKIALMQSEMTIYSTMNDLLHEARKKTIDTPIANLPMNASFWTMADKLLTKGEQREIFLGDKDASKRPELQFFPGDPLFIQWCTFLDQQIQQKDQKKQAEKEMAMNQDQIDNQDQQENNTEETPPKAPEEK